MDDTGDITLDQRYTDTDVWCEWAYKMTGALDHVMIM